MARAYPNFKVHLLDDNGNPANGWKIKFFEPGTSTLKTTYTTPAAAVANANPVVLNARGEADIYADGIYDIEVFNASDVSQYTVSNWGANIAVTTTASNNLLSGGSFEIDTDSDGVPDNWEETLTGTGTAALNTANNSHGQTSYGLTTAVASDVAQIQSVAFMEVSDLQALTVTFDLNATVAATDIDVDMLWFDSNQTALTGGSASTSVYDDTATNPTSFTQKTKTVTPPSTARYGKIRIKNTFNSAADTTYFDNVRIIAGDTSYIGLSDTPASYTAGLVPEVTSAADAIEFVDRRIPGYRLRSNFAWASTTTITINAGIYHLAGTSDQNVFWNSALTYTPGSGGSNSDSTDLGASQTHYVYIDDSAVETLGVATALTNSEFINVTTAPTYNQTKKGWYGTAVGNLQTTDRCIFSFTTDGSNNIDEFYHSGERVTFENEIVDYAATDIDTFTDTPSGGLSIPAFATKAQILAFGAVAAVTWYWRVNGAATTVQTAMVVTSAATVSAIIDVQTDSSQVFEMGPSGSNTATIAVTTQGWYFPEGM